MELSASFSIQSKVPEIERQTMEGRKLLLQCDEKDADIVWLKNGEVKIEDFEFA